MKKENFNNIGVLILALFVGYSSLVLIAFLFHTDFSVTGFVASDETTSSEKDASLALGESNQVLEEMVKLGFNVVRVKDLIEEARAEMALKNYERVIAISNEIDNLKQKAIDVQNQIKDITLKIDESKKSGFGTAEAELLLNLSFVEFTLENYEGAEKFILDGISKLNFIAEEEAKILIENLNNLKNELKENKLNITRLENIILDAENALEIQDVKKISILGQEFVSLNKSANILIEAKNEITAMGEAGFGTTRVNDILNEAKFALELGYYDKIEGIKKNIIDLKLKAFQIRADIISTKTKIEQAKSYGLDVKEAEALLNSSIDEFNLENYEDAEKLVKQSSEKTEKLVSSSLLFGTVLKSELKFNAINFLKKFWLVVLVIVTIASIFGITAFQRVSIMILESSLRGLEKEKEAINSLIKKAQTAYFKDNKMDKSTYDVTIDRYQERLIQVKEKIPIVNAKLKRKKEKAWELIKLVKLKK